MAIIISNISLMLCQTKNKNYPNLTIFIPLYSCPSDEEGRYWLDVVNCSKLIDTFVVWGVICKEDDYKNALYKLKKAKIKLLAYISTHNSKRPINEIISKIKFYSKFQINGFFFDEIDNNN